MNNRIVFFFENTEPYKQKYEITSYPIVKLNEKESYEDIISKIYNISKYDKSRVMVNAMFYNDNLDDLTKFIETFKRVQRAIVTFNLQDRQKEQIKNCFTFLYDFYKKFEYVQKNINQISVLNDLYDNKLKAYADVEGMMIVKKQKLNLIMVKRDIEVSKIIDSYNEEMMKCEQEIDDLSNQLMKIKHNMI